MKWYERFGHLLNSIHKVPTLFGGIGSFCLVLPIKTLAIFLGLETKESQVSRPQLNFMAVMRQAGSLDDSLIFLKTPL